LIQLYKQPMRYQNGKLAEDDGRGNRDKTIAAGILKAHNVSGDDKKLNIKFDALTSHDITYVGIIQTARASGMQEFPLPYVLTNCHNSLCAVGGTINEDDHVFGYSAAKKYGGVFVPAHVAVIHQFMREMYAGCGTMILGSDSHTRYGALGCIAIGEGGPELAKQLLGRTYDIDYPEVVGVYVHGAPAPGVGPQDVALALIGATFKNGFFKNKIVEFFGPGVANLSVDYRIGIDVMTTETTCLGSIWATDGKVEEWLALHGRPDDYKTLSPEEGALYDSALDLDLSKIRPMIALPFHPSNVYPIEELVANPGDILRTVEKEASEIGLDASGLLSKIKNGVLYVDQGIIAGCAGGMYNNLMAAADILENRTAGSGGFTLSAYPASQPIFMALLKNGAATRLTAAGAMMKTAFCGPCFGAGDVPANGQLSVRHTTRNFPSREGSKPGEGQTAFVALMDARSVAATAANNGRLTPATEFAIPENDTPYTYDPGIYEKRTYVGVGKPLPEEPLVSGPNITDWPVMPAMKDSMLLKFASVIHDPVTTTDELIPSGETSSYRSNPVRLSEFTLSRKDPGYVGRAKEVAATDIETLAHITELLPGFEAENTLYKSVIFAVKPGDGSAREQAASCQRVLGGGANVVVEYATKRYRSNLINWGMLPLRLENPDDYKLFEVGDYLYLPGVKKALEEGESELFALLVKGEGEKVQPISLTMDSLTEAERSILLAGALMNYYANEGK
jgi:aconitate hydratase